MCGWAGSQDDLGDGRGLSDLKQGKVVQECSGQSGTLGGRASRVKPWMGMDLQGPELDSVT